MIKKLAVYCGARDGQNPHYELVAKQLGVKMASKGIDLVYGGGRYGLMGAVARGVLEHQGNVYGVITKQLAGRGVGFDQLTNLQVVPDMDTRKKTMMGLADGMLALPGGLGTLEEISQAASWMTLGNNPKPVAFYNFDGYYDHLQGLLVKMNQAGFLEQRYVDSLYFGTDFDQILDFMNHYHAPLRRQYQSK